MNIINQYVSYFLTITGLTFYLPIFIYDFFTSMNLVGVIGLSIYFANVSGSLMIALGVILFQVDKNEPKQIIYIGAVTLFALMALTRLFVFYNTDGILTIMPSILAKIVMASEFMLFTFLYTSYCKELKSIESK